jgi:xylulokinase
VETHAYPTGCCFVEHPGWLSGGAVRWVTRLLGLADDRALDRLAATAPPGSDGVVFIPALTGAMTPVWRSRARGTLHGLTAAHGPQHIARAVLEGLAFACRDVVERLASLGLATDEVLLLGGGSRSPLWRQIRADVLGRPHAVATNPDSCPIGAGMVAAVASGAVPEFPPVAEPVIRVGPGADRVAMDDAYGRYGRLVTQVAPLGDSPW